jgi:hypothetical protein
MDDFTIINKTIAFIAKRNSGKSCILKYLVMSEIDRFSKIFVVCPTERINRFYSDIVEDDCIFDEYSEEWTMRLIERLTSINANKPKQEQKQVLLILDDCISQTGFHQSKTLHTLFSRCRHFCLSVLITSQILTGIPPIVRQNCDYVLCSQMNKTSVDMLVAEYLTGDIDKQEFIKIYKQSTKDYGFLLINNNSVKDNSDLNSLYGIVKCPEDIVI